MMKSESRMEGKGDTGMKAFEQKLEAMLSSLATSIDSMIKTRAPSTTYDVDLERKVFVTFFNDPSRLTLKK